MGRYSVRINGKKVEADLLHSSGSSVSFVVNGKRYDVELSPLVQHAGSASTSGVAVKSTPPQPAPAASAKMDGVYSPMPGIIVSVSVKKGQKVEPGQTLLVMEAMKMENNVTAPRSGKIKEVLIKPGQEVGNQQLLISFE